MPLKKHNSLKNPNWRETDQLVIYKHDQEVEVGSTEKQLHLSSQRELEASILGFKSGSATLQPNRALDSCDWPGLNVCFVEVSALVN